MTRTISLHRRDAETQRLRSKFLFCVFVSLWVLISASAPGCARTPAAAFPDRVSGWTKLGETRTFTAENLYEYIDGDAEKYVQAGVREVATGDYDYGGSSNAGVADIFVMGSAQGAGKVFESQSEAGSKPVQIGEAARLYKGNLTFRKGPYFVRLVAYDQRANDALVELGKAIAARLP